MLTLCWRLWSVLSHRNTSGSLRMSSARTLPLWSNWRRKFEREISRTASQIDDYISRLQIQCLDDIGWPLPLVPFSLNDVQTRKGIETLVSRIDEEQDRNGAQNKKGKFDAIAQSAGTHDAVER